MLRSPLLRLALLLMSAAVGPGCFQVLVSPARIDAQALAGVERFDASEAARGFADLLARHVDGEGRVDYVGLAAERGALDRYVATLAEVGPRTRPELFPDEAARLAYLLDAYNALVLFQVLERRPLGSVADAKYDFFYFTCFPLDGDTLNLYDLENERIRGSFHEPRVHFALNCASVGCPRLPAEPFSGERLELQLAREQERFLYEERNVAVIDGTLWLSAIFDWYEDDFAPDPGRWVAARRPDLPAFQTVRFRPYDWSLNAQPGRD